MSALVGHEFRDTRNRRITRVVDVAADGSSFTLESVQAPGAGAGSVADAHVHDSWNERFEVLRGIANYRLGNEVLELREGESVLLPLQVPHAHPWNAGDAELRFRQTSLLLNPDPAAIRDTIEAFAMLFWLMDQGGANRERPPLLQGALILRKLGRHGGYLARPPKAVQKPLIALLAKLGELRGYQEFDPRCMQP